MGIFCEKDSSRYRSDEIYDIGESDDSEEQDETTEFERRHSRDMIE